MSYSEKFTSIIYGTLSALAIFLSAVLTNSFFLFLSGVDKRVNPKVFYTLSGFSEELLRSTFAAAIILLFFHKKNRSQTIKTISIMVALTFTFFEKILSHFGNKEMILSIENNLLTIVAVETLSIFLHFFIHLFLFYLAVDSLVKRKWFVLLLAYVMHAMINFAMALTPIQKYEPATQVDNLIFKFLFLIIIIAIVWFFQRNRQESLSADR